MRFATISRRILTAGVTTHAVDGWMYINFPTLHSCCKCTNTIGPVRYDWMQDGGGSYVGVAEVRGMKVDEFLKQGASDNHFYVERDADQRPVRYMEHKNGMLKQWDFDLASFEPGPSPPGTFDPPKECQNRCLAAICLV